MWGQDYVCVLKVRETGSLASSLLDPRRHLCPSGEEQVQVQPIKPKGNILGRLSEISTGLPEITVTRRKRLIPQGKVERPS